MVWSLKQALEATWDLPLNAEYGNPKGRAKWKYYGMVKDKHNTNERRTHRNILGWRAKDGDQLEDE